MSRNTKAKAIKVANKKFPSFRQACLYYGVDDRVANRRLKIGWSLQQSLGITEAPKKVRRGASVTIKGEEFVSLKAACRHFKFDPATINYRLSNDWTLEEAFELVDKELYIVGDFNFKSQEKACEYFDKERHTIKRRLDRGWSREEAFGLVKRKESSVCKGILYIVKNSVNSKVYIGITTVNLKDRFARHKYDAKRGSTTKFHTALRKIGSDKFRIKKLKIIDNRHDLGKLEVKYIKHYNSIKNGYNTAVGGEGLGERHGKTIEYDGIKFVSKRALALYLNVRPSIIYDRTRRGIPLNQPIKEIK